MPMPAYSANTSHPVVPPYPQPGPAVYPYQTNVAPYPTYPPQNSPYPQQSAPYPSQPAPYPQSNVLPPAYNEVVGSSDYQKQSPYNPNFSG
jgi:hypothetical protein